MCSHSVCFSKRNKVSFNLQRLTVDGLVREGLLGVGAECLAKSQQ